MGTNQNYLGGFDTAVLTHESGVNPKHGKVSRFSEKGSKPRLFLISKIPPSPPINGRNSGRSKKRTLNRKRMVFEDTVTLGEEDYNVNTSKSGIYLEILEAMIKQFQLAARKWGRVFVLRFDLHQKHFTSDNKHVTAFRKRLVQKLKREYGFKEVGFCWVREQERAKAQHYHWVLFLDGNKIRHSSRIIQMIKQAWERPDGYFHVPVIKRPFYFANDEKTVKDAIYRASYLAKVRGKGYRASQTKDFQCSRMRPG